MPPAPLPVDEPARLAALHAHVDPDAGPDSALQALAEAAAAALEMPIGGVTLIGAERQTFLGCCGLPTAVGTRREHAFCGYTILQDDILEVPDARADPRFADNPFVTGAPHLRFYAAAPLTTADGYRLGSLCVLDLAPRRLAPQQRAQLRKFAESASAVLAKLRALRASEARLQDALADAEEASRAKSVFLATMSHELRTPLNAVIGFSEVLQNQCYGPMPDARYIDYARDIRESGRHLLTLINDILDVCRLDAGQAQLYPEPIDLAEEFEWTRQMVRQHAERRQAAVEIDVPADLPAPWFDRRALRQILVKLASNAIKYGPTGVRVRLSAAPDGGFVGLTVADDGPGIPPEFRRRLFEPFARADSGINRTTEGTGLGLALCKGLLDAGGGEIAVESAPDGGVRVRVRLPRAAPESDGSFGDNIHRLDRARGTGTAG